MVVNTFNVKIPGISPVHTDYSIRTSGTAFDSGYTEMDTGSILFQGVYIYAGSNIILARQQI